MRLPGIPGKRINLAEEFVRVLNESNALKCGCVRTRGGGGGHIMRECAFREGVGMQGCVHSI